MVANNNYKSEIDINRTDRFSYLYVIISKISLACVTYFFVGLTISLVYVLSDMDYFTLNGQFRTQRFFTDDGYYYTKQLVIIFGLFAFIITMFFGPVGKLYCIMLSWFLSYCYIEMFFDMCKLNYIKQCKYLIDCIPHISLISHLLLCNIIFVLFDQNLSSLNNIPELNNPNRVSKPNVNYTFYQMISFIMGYFLGFSSISLVFKNFGSFTKNELVNKNIYSNFNILYVISIILSISTFSSILLTINFLYKFHETFKILKSDKFENICSNIRNIRNVILLLIKELTWMPLFKLSINSLSKVISNVLYFELVFMWFLNPLNLSVIPYTIGTHFQYQKLSHIHKMLFSVMFVIMVLVLNQDIIINCIYLITDLNIAIFKIMYTHSYFQISDYYLREKSISTSTQTNYTSSFCDCDNRSNKHFNYKDKQHTNNIGLPSIAWYPHISSYHGDIENEDKTALSFMNQMMMIFQLLDYNLTYGGDTNINSIIEQLSFLSNNKKCDKDMSNLSLYLPIQFRDQLMSIISNAICDYDLDKSFSSIKKVCIGLMRDLHISSFFTNSKNFILIITLVVPISICLKSICVDSFFESSFQAIICDLKKYGNLIREHQTDMSSLDKESDSGSNFKLMSTSLRYNNNIIYDVLSHMSTMEFRQILIEYFILCKKTTTIISILTLCSKCCCICCFNDSCESDSCLLSLILLLSARIYPNQFKSMFLKSLLENQLNHFCMCLIIQYQLIPVLYWSIYHLTDFIYEYFTTSKREFNRYIHPIKYTIDLSRAMILVVDIIEKITEHMAIKYVCICTSSCGCRTGSTCNSSCQICISLVGTKCCSCPSPSKDNCICCCSPANGGCTRCQPCQQPQSGKCCCCCICFCKFEKDPDYFYFSYIIIYICLLMEYLFNFENQDIKNCIKYLSKLKSELDIVEIVLRIPRISLFSVHSISINHIISGSNGNISIVLGIFRGSFDLFSNGIAGIFKITTHVISLSILNDKVFKEFFEKISIMSFYMINSTEIKLKTKLNLIKTTNFFSLNYIARVKNNSQQLTLCSVSDISKCKLKMTCFILLKHYFDLMSVCVSNFFMLSFMFASIIGASWPIPPLKDMLEANLSLLSCIGILSRNTMINNRSTCEILEKYNSSKNELEIKQNEYNIKSDGKKLLSNRMIIILIILIISMLFGSIKIEPDLNVIPANPYESEENYKPLDSLINNDNNLPITDLEKNTSVLINNNYNYGADKTKNIKHKIKIFNPKVLLLSIISPIYINILMNLFYTKLDLDYTLWSYLVNLVLMSGMIFSLFSKHFLQLYSFFNVLDNYGSYLSKDDNLMYNMLDEDQQDVFKNTRPMMMYNMLKSSGVDLLSLLNTKNLTERTTTFMNIKNKLFPYKEMSKPVRRIVKTCYSYSHRFDKIRDEVLDGIGIQGEYIDIVSVLDFLSYNMIANSLYFVDQYELYFSGDETYMAWALRKHMNNNVFISEYYRHQTLNNIEQQIKQLINNNHKLGANNLMLLWQLFSRSEVDLISTKSISYNLDEQMIKDQRDTIKNLYHEEYLKGFYNYQNYIASKLFNAKVVNEHKSTEIKSTLEFIDLLNKNILDRNKLNELTSNYFDDEYETKLTSMSIPTITCNIKGNKQDVKNRVHKFCDDWLEHKLQFCKHMNNLECEKAVNIAYNTVVDLANNSDDLYEDVLDLIYETDLDNVYDLKQSIDTQPILWPVCRDCESMSTFYINKYLSTIHINIDKMLTPLGMYLSWNGTPIDKHHLNKCSHTH